MWSLSAGDLDLISVLKRRLWWSAEGQIQLYDDREQQLLTGIISHVTRQHSAEYWCGVHLIKDTRASSHESSSVLQVQMAFSLIFIRMPLIITASSHSASLCALNHVSWLFKEREQVHLRCSVCLTENNHKYTVKKRKFPYNCSWLQSKVQFLCRIMLFCSMKNCKQSLDKFVLYILFLISLFKCWVPADLDSVWKQLFWCFSSVWCCRISWSFGHSIAQVFIFIFLTWSSVLLWMQYENSF